jgi:Uma2 family endonuclease
LVPRADFYATAHPKPRQVQLLIEVADTTFAFDTKVKAPLYAKAGIRELWVIDLKKQRVLVYTQPRAGEYARVRTYQVGERFTSRRFPGVEFAVKDLLV